MKMFRYFWTKVEKIKISLIGSLVISNNIYYAKIMQPLEEKLKNMEVSYHIIDYRKSDFHSYLELFDTMLLATELLQLNVVTFKKRGRFSSQILYGKIDDMVYAKIPDRTIYGSLKGYSSFTKVEAKVYIEYAVEYEKRGLDKLIKNQLNIRSLYRYDSFKVKSVGLYSENTHIGIEFTDICLGILR